MENENIIQEVKNQVWSHCELNEDYFEGGEFNDVIFINKKGYYAGFTVAYEYSPGDRVTPDYLHMEVSTNWIEALNEDGSVELIYTNK